MPQLAFETKNIILKKKVLGGGNSCARSEAIVFLNLIERPLIFVPKNWFCLHQT
jgi:hypothetical protein